MQFDTPAWRLGFATARLTVETPGEPWYGTATIFQRDGNVFLVTCRHVLEGGKHGNVFFTKSCGNGRPAIGEAVRIDIADLETKWVGHPDPKIDVAVIPMTKIQRPEALREPIYLEALDSRAFPTPRTLNHLDAIEEVLFVGYPGGYYDRVNLVPIVRRAITATPVHYNYDDRPEFLIDGAVYFGSSGGPVLLIRKYNWLKRPLARASHFFVFLGIVSEVVRFTFDGHIGFIHPLATSEGVASARLLNLGVILKSHLIEETISEYLKQARDGSRGA